MLYYIPTSERIKIVQIKNHCHVTIKNFSESKSIKLI